MTPLPPDDRRLAQLLALAGGALVLVCLFAMAKAALL